MSCKALNLFILCLLLAAAAHVPPLELHFDTLGTPTAFLSLGWSSSFMQWQHYEPLNPCSFWLGLFCLLQSLKTAYSDQTVEIIAQFVSQSLWPLVLTVFLALKTWIQLRGEWPVHSRTVLSKSWWYGMAFENILFSTLLSPLAKVSVLTFFSSLV